MVYGITLITVQSITISKFKVLSLLNYYSYYLALLLPLLLLLMYLTQSVVPTGHSTSVDIVPDCLLQIVVWRVLLESRIQVFPEVYWKDGA